MPVGFFLLRLELHTTKSIVIIWALALILVAACGPKIAAIDSETLAWRASTALGYEAWGQLWAQANKDRWRIQQPIAEPTDELKGFSNSTEIWYLEKCYTRCDAKDRRRLHSSRLTIFSFSNAQDAAVAYNLGRIIGGKKVDDKSDGNLVYEVYEKGTGGDGSGEGSIDYLVWARHGRVLTFFEANSVELHADFTTTTKLDSPDQPIKTVKAIHWMISDMEKDLAGRNK